MHSSATSILFTIFMKKIKWIEAIVSGKTLAFHSTATNLLFAIITGNSNSKSVTTIPWSHALSVVNINGKNKLVTVECIARMLPLHLGIMPFQLIIKMVKSKLVAVECKARVLLLHHCLMPLLLLLKMAKINLW